MSEKFNPQVPLKVMTRVVKAELIIPKTKQVNRKIEKVHIIRRVEAVPSESLEL
jgi:hypothetical protein